MSSPVHIAYSHSVLIIALKLTIIFMVAWIALTVFQLALRGQLLSLFDWSIMRSLWARHTLFTAMFLLPILIAVLIRPRSKSKQDRLVHGSVICLIAGGIYFAISQYFYHKGYVGSGYEGVGASIILALCLVALNSALYLPAILQGKTFT